MRKLSLLVMVAIVISLIWRPIGAGGSEAARLLQLEGWLWRPTMSVSQHLRATAHFSGGHLFSVVTQSPVPSSTAQSGRSTAFAASLGLGSKAVASRSGR
jgi:hypothetical protein